MTGVNRASMDKKPHDVASMFDHVAARYDLTNDVLTLGAHRLWRRAAIKACNARRGDRVLDIAAGTGCSSEPFADAEVHVVPADFSLGMLRHGRRRRPDLPFTAADATALPFADGSFDVVTMSYGLRNVQDPDAALREYHRVTKPGGRVVILEFSKPTNAAFHRLYSDGALRAVPQVARRVSSNPDSYVYLAESIRAWPDQAALADRLREAGWSDVTWRNLTGGIVALHVGHKVV